MFGFAMVLAQSESGTLLDDSVTGSDWIRAGIVLCAALVVAVAVWRLSGRQRSES